ncbi:MAG: YchJ family protein [Neisseriaceae bacterium]|nr:YchJ family protein [Neisseriaceae bacterium]
MTPIAPDQACPCGLAHAYSACCGPYHQGQAVAPTPEALMRSRYSAFVAQDADYLIKTWHPSCGVAQFKTELVADFEHTEWLGLNVVATATDGDAGMVTFAARFHDDRDHSTHLIHERSRFVREAGQWYYLDGNQPKVGRNDDCPCGSGKKFKKCCA